MSCTEGLSCPHVLWNWGAVHSRNDTAHSTWAQALLLEAAASAKRHQWELRRQAWPKLFPTPCASHGVTCGYRLCALFRTIVTFIDNKKRCFFRNCLHVGFSRQLPKSNRRPCCHAILVQHQRQRESTVPSVPIAADGLWTYDNLRHLHEWIMLMNNYVGSVRKKNNWYMYVVQRSMWMLKKQFISILWVYVWTYND